MSKKKKNSVQKKDTIDKTEIDKNKSNEKLVSEEKSKHEDSKIDNKKRKDGVEKKKLEDTKRIDDAASIENILENEINKHEKSDRVKRERHKEVVMAAKEREKELLKERKSYRHPFIHTFLVLVLFTSLAYFIIILFYTKNGSITTLINSLLLMVFSLLFVAVSISTVRKNKNGFLLSGFILLCYFSFGILTTLGIINLSSKTVIDFTNMSLTDVIKWSEKNSINIVQDYEYSDMISEYHIISQSVLAGTKLKDIDSITVAVSEGANPSKEIVIPNMISWESERVLKFIKENHLSNILVDFIESSKAVDTVVEQSKSGNMRRDEALKIVFSYGEELEYDEVKLQDLTEMSKFEATFYLKQHHLNYEFDEVFSSDVKRGFVVKQSIKAGDSVKVNGDKIIVSISKGPEIKVPDLTAMSLTDVTEWVIKNKLKLEFTDKYDDTVKENSVISANYKMNEVISEGTLVKVVVSRGKLLMKKFGSYDEFRDWALKYEINYEEQHQFSNDVAAGNVISYSYSEGETIKNNDSIIVIISDGRDAEVPYLIGNSKKDATNKLKNNGFNYTYVYKCSNSVGEGNVIRQSIGSGSKVSYGSTVTLTISTGKCPVNSGGSSSGGNSTPAPKPSQPPVPVCDTSKGATFYVGVGNNGSQVLSSTKAQNPGFTIVANYVDQCPNGDANSGAVCNSGSYDGKWISYCNTISLTIVK